MKLYAGERSKRDYGHQYYPNGKDQANGLYVCHAQFDRAKETQCKYYEGTMATCAGEVSVCRFRGEEYPLLGYCYCDKIR